MIAAEVQFRMGFPPDEAIDEVISTYGGSMVAAGYAIASQGRTSAAYSRRFIPVWAIVFAVLTVWVFLLGLLFLLFRETATVSLRAVPDPAGALVIVDLIAPAPMVRFWQERGQALEAIVPSRSDDAGTTLIAD